MFRIVSRILLLCLIISTAQAATPRQSTINWLKRQIVPNKVVRVVGKGRRNLILSYETTDKISSISSLYDNGLAVIAFTIKGLKQNARNILDALMRMGGEGGELFFTFNTKNNWPGKDDKHEAIIRSGASAWAGYAFVFYIRAQLLSNPDALQNDKKLQNYLKYAELIADNMLKRHITKPKDFRHGLISGGWGSYRLTYNKELNTVEERFIAQEATWCSVEHNIDMYFFLTSLAKVSTQKRYAAIAKQISRTLIKKCWSNDYGQFYQALRLDGPDKGRALDCASWGALFLKSKGKDELAKKALTTCNDYRSQTPKGFGYKAYINQPIYANSKVGSFFFKNRADNNWNKIDMMWTEGALGVALAYIRLRDKTKAQEIIDEVLKYQTPGGGIKYSSKAIEHQFTTAPSVASAAWLILCRESLKENKTAALFWDS